MHFFLGEAELLKVRRSVSGTLARRYSSSRYLFSTDGFRDWIEGVVDLGIAEALRSDDWSCQDDLDEKAVFRRKARYVMLKARMVARAELRAERRQLRATETTQQSFQAGHDNGVEDWVISDNLRAAVEHLSPDQQAAITMVYFQDIPIETVAARLGKARGSVDMILLRAKTKLRKHLEESTQRGDQVFEGIQPRSSPAKSSRPQRPDGDNLHLRHFQNIDSAGQLRDKLVQLCRQAMSSTAACKEQRPTG